MNGSICHPQLIEFIKQCNLHELLLSCKPGVPAPATFHHGSRYSRCLIDGTWATPDVIISQSLYFTVTNSLGDHHTIIIDIDLLATIGEPHFTIIHPPGCCLNCSLPMVQEKYLNILEEFASTQHLHFKLTWLFHLALVLATSRDVLQTAMEKFNYLEAEGMHYVEKRCQHLCVGEVQFSPELNMWWQCQDLWLFALKRKQGWKIKATTIKKLAQQCQVLLHPLSVSEVEAKQHYICTRDKYYELKPQHDLLCQDFLSSWLNDPSLFNQQQAIAKLVQLKHQCDTFWHTCYLKQPNKGASISQIEVSSPVGPQVHFTSNAVETALCQTLCHHFMKAHGSPFLHHPLSDLVRRYGEGPAVKSILKGTFQCPPDTEEYTHPGFIIPQPRSKNDNHLPTTTPWWLHGSLAESQRKDILIHFRLTFWPL